MTKSLQKAAIESLHSEIATIESLHFKMEKAMKIQIYCKILVVIVMSIVVVL